MLLKAHVGADAIQEREKRLNEAALSRWSDDDRIVLLGNLKAPRIPIFSFEVRDAEEAKIHHQLITRMLSDMHGVQARGGCACAGPYAHRLLDLTPERSDAFRSRLAEGHELEKPGWTRVNFSYATSDVDAQTMIEAVVDVARAASLSERYVCDRATARFHAEL